MEDSNNNSVEVYESYKFSDGMIVAFLKSTAGKIPLSTLLKDEAGREWMVKQYIWTTNSPDGYERIRSEEQQNIFQYYLLGINQDDKPTKGSFLNLKSEVVKEK
jgi:hypothetical protein